MKKSTCLLLCFALILCTFTFSVSAENSDITTKYDAELIKFMEPLSPADYVGVWVWLKGSASEDEIERLTFEKCGLTKSTLSVDYSKYESEEDAKAAEKENEELYTSTRNQVISDFYENYNKSVLKEYNIDEKYVPVISTSTASFIAALTVEELNSLANSEEVARVNLYIDEEVLPPDTVKRQPEYKDIVVGKLNLRELNPDSYYYEELYKFISPDYYKEEYMLIKVNTNVSDEGEFVFTDMDEYRIVTAKNSLYCHGIYIYMYNQDVLYTLEEAYYAKIEGIYAALNFLKGRAVVEIGDADGNNRITIKDATIIQKHLANIISLEEHHNSLNRAVGIYAADYNADKCIDIKDVTAIQKHLAKI